MFSNRLGLKLLLREYLHYQINKEEKPIKDVKVNLENNTERNKAVVIGDSMTKYLKPNDLGSRKNFVKISTQSGATTEDMLG